MEEDKPVHIPKEAYPEVSYPAELTALPVPSRQREQSIHLRDYWNVLIVRRWVIAAVLVTTVVVTMIVTLQQTPIYSAEATLQIDRENQNILSFKDIYQIETQTDDTLQTQYKVLGARSLARRVVERLKLDQVPEFAPGKPSLLTLLRRSIQDFLPRPQSTAASSDAEQDRLRGFVDSYLGRLNVSQVPRTRLVKVSFEAKDPRLAALVINEHARQFIEQNLQFKYDATTQASEFLANEIKGLKGTLENSEDKLQDYSRENQILFTDDGKNTASDKLRQLEEEFTKAQADRIEKEALVGQIEAGHADSLPQLLTSPLIAQLSVQGAELRRQEANLAVTFGPDYPSRQRIRNQIDGIGRDILAEKLRVIQAVKSEHAGARDREKLLAAELDRQRTVVYKINQDIIQYNILKREVDSNKQLYDGLLTRLKEAGVSAGLRASNIRVVDKAEIPVKPTRPQKTVNLILSTLVGLVSGIGLAFLQEYLDNTIKSPDDVTRTLGIPALAVVPKLSSISGRRGYKYGYKHGYGGYGYSASAKATDLAAIGSTESKSNGKAEAHEKGKTQQVDLIIHTSPTSLMSEAYRSLRTSLLLSAADHPPRTVLVTSSVPSEGKTATALNLAASLTQSGARTLLIDGDMRRPRVHAALNLGNVPGLSSFLTGAATLQQVIHETVVPNLFVIPCGAIPPNPGELILSKRFNSMMSAAQGYFEYIIVDSPPLSHVSDGRVLANSCEAAILVVKASSTSRHAAIKAMEQLSESRARVAGAVLNDVDVRSRKSNYSGYYYSGYSGRYGGYGYIQR